MPQPDLTLFGTFLRYTGKSVFFILFGFGVGLCLFIFYDLIDLLIKSIVRLNNVFPEWKPPEGDSQGYAICNIQNNFLSIIIEIIGMKCACKAWKAKRKWRFTFFIYVTAYLSETMIIVIYPLRLGIVIFPITVLVGFPCEVVDINRSQGISTIFYDLRPLFGMERIK